MIKTLLIILILASPFALALNTSGVAWWNSAEGNYRRATLITPQHALSSTHYSLKIGNTVCFLQDICRKITKKVSVGDDIDILEFSESLPEAVTYYRIFSQDSIMYFPYSLVGFNQKDEKIKMVIDKWELINHYTSIEKPLVGGDSGNPIFTTYFGETILFSHQTRTLSSTNFAFKIDDINKGLQSLGSKYTVTSVKRSPTLYLAEKLFTYFR